MLGWLLEVDGVIDRLYNWKFRGREGMERICNGLFEREVIGKRLVEELSE